LQEPAGLHDLYRPRSDRLRGGGRHGLTSRRTCEERR
jgi:hypothetical protein